MHMRNGSRSSAATDRDADTYADIPLYEAVPPPFVRCFPEILRAHGYYCTNAAKKDYQFKEPPTVWDESSGQAHWRRRPKSSPFFAVFNCGMTHESQAFPDARIRPEVVSPTDVPLPPYYPDTPAARDAMARTYNNIAALDAWVGERLCELEEAGLLESTIVFFYSDHGVGLPRGKRDLYDTGVRVPLIVRFPDRSRAGTTTDRVVSFVDFGPTVLSLAGIEPDERLDGRAFLGRFEGAPRPLAFVHADRMDSVYDTKRGVTDGRFKYIRNFTPDRPLIGPNAYRERLPLTADLYRLQENGADRPEQWQIASTVRPIEEFYDTEADPWEVDNLAADPAHAGRMGDMRGALADWMARTADLGMIMPESSMVRRHIWPPGGVQPTTAIPEIVIRDGAATIRCATEGASIGYRHADEDIWRVYIPRSEIDPSRAIQAIAHRIGFRPSDIASLEPAP